MDLGASTKHRKCQKKDGDPAADLSLNLHRRVEDPGFASCRGFSRRIFEIGDGCINEGINGEKDNDFYALIAPDSIFATKKLRERIGPTQMGQGSGNVGIKEVMLVTQTIAEKMGQVGREEAVGYMADVLRAQQEMVVVNTEDCSKSSKNPRTRQSLTQSQGALVEFQLVEDKDLLKIPERRSTTDLSQSQCEIGGQRCARRRSLEHILKSSCRVKIGGSRSCRAQWKKGSLWDKHYMKAILQSEETNSVHMVMIVQAVILPVQEPTQEVMPAQKDNARSEAIKKADFLISSSLQLVQSIR
ncbi:hypothetical protein Ancab_038076, partial [Ancistrocladus abbreviatus]